MRNRAEECDEKSRSCHWKPRAVPTNQNRGKSNSVRRPYRAKITAADVRCRLAEFACDQIGDEDEGKLKEISSTDVLLESLILKGASRLGLQRIYGSHDYQLRYGHLR